MSDWLSEAQMLCAPRRVASVATGRAEVSSAGPMGLFRKCPGSYGYLRAQQSGPWPDRKAARL